MLIVPITVYFDEIPQIKNLAKVVEIRPSAIVVNMYDAMVKLENEKDAQELFVAGREMSNRRA